ncbi:MAG TPA: hypothetical protein VGC36_16170, partial [Rhizomicrobium sp.]
MSQRIIRQPPCPAASIARDFFTGPATLADSGAENIPSRRWNNDGGASFNDVGRNNGPATTSGGAEQS